MLGSRRILRAERAGNGIGPARVFHETPEGRATMFTLRSMLAVVLLLPASGAYAQTNTFATGNLHFDAKDIDTNGDQMISREEMMKYSDQMWDKMTNGKTTIPISVAAKDFATGGLNFKAQAMDTDHDGTISKEEFQTYAGRKFDKMKKTNDMIPVIDAAKAFSRGNADPSQANTPK
jgi:hypothetical protein